MMTCPHRLMSARENIKMLFGKTSHITRHSLVPMANKSDFSAIPMLPKSGGYSNRGKFQYFVGAIGRFYFQWLN